MARIRTIKPEFPQSESMGNVSRDARLLFILTWTLADDSGRLRGNSRMLASLLFPYDNDAPTLIDGWLSELSKEGSIFVYEIEGATYIQIAKWLIHQKIDKPSSSKIPEFVESSRILANVRGGIKDQGSEDQGKDQGEENTLVPGVAEDKFPRPAKPDCPHQEIIAIYHEVLPQCPAIRDWTPVRATQLRARWNESSDRQNLEYWKRLFQYIGECDFLVGRSAKPFFADLEWITKSQNFTKIREGKYENR